MFYVSNGKSWGLSYLNPGDFIVLMSNKFKYQVVKDITDDSMVFDDLVNSGYIRRTNVQLKYDILADYSPNDPSIDGIADSEDFVDDSTWYDVTTDTVWIKLYGKWVRKDKIVIEDRDPTIEENLKKGTIWVNDKNGIIYTCVDDTKDKNIWQGSEPNKIIRPLPPIERFDVFNDGSSLLYFPFNDTLKDLGGRFEAQEHNGNIKFSKHLLNTSAYFENRVYLTIPKLCPFEESKIAVNIWFRSDKKPIRDTCLVHFSYTGSNTFSLWYTRRGIFFIINDRTYFLKRFNSDNDFYEIYSVYMDTDGKCALNGGEVILNYGTTVDPRRFKMDAIIGADRDGRSVNDWYTGYIDEYRIFNRPLTNQEIKDLYVAGLTRMGAGGES